MRAFIQTLIRAHNTICIYTFTYVYTHTDDGKNTLATVEQEAEKTFFSAKKARKQLLAQEDAFRQTPTSFAGETHFCWGVFFVACTVCMCVCCDVCGNT